MKKIYGVLLSSVLAASLVTACSSSEPSNSGSGGSGGNTQTESSTKAAGFVPEKDFEMVVAYSAGGGSDINGRTIAQILTDSKIIDQKMLVVNKPGGSGAVGNTYLNSKKGDGHFISTWVSGQQASAVVNKADVTLDKVTPLATLALDSFLVCVDKDSPYQTFEDLAKAAKENPDQVKVGGSGIGNEDHLFFHLINKHVGTQLKYVAFNSGGETLSALLGGHVQVVLSNPNEIIPQIEAGEVRALATSSGERLSSPVDQVPTFKDLGYPDVKLEMFRGIVGPGEMSAEAVKYWEEKLKQVSESKEWQENYIKKYSLQPTFKNAEESKKYFQENLDQYVQVHKDLGTIK